jgi:anthranilate synthase component I
LSFLTSVSMTTTQLTRTTRILPADLLTPVGAYMRLREELGAPSFLLESVERGEQVGRFSFLGAGGAETPDLDEAVAFAGLHPGPRPGEPPFLGGAVGYLGYDWACELEPVPLPAAHADDADIPTVRFMLARSVVAFDHVRRTLAITGEPGDVERIAQILSTPAAAGTAAPIEAGQVVVETAKRHIAAGDAFQIVPSLRARRRTAASPFAIYRALRAVNPSPYMFLLDFGSHQLIGSSPETHVRLDPDGTCELRPIAGTRPRGTTRERDDELAAELMASEKERAEHVMLVDLARNDLGRVCVPGTVEVPDFMRVEHYSHVMHLVSTVSGNVAAEHDALDVLDATFPAGTVSGAPKVRAMEIIEDLEPVRRGVYAGAVGHFDYHGNLDLAIAIRTLVYQGKTAHWGVGAGIVADSVPEQEWDETMAKGRALWLAVQRAERGVDGGGSEK